MERVVVVVALGAVAGRFDWRKSARSVGEPG
jgi:hypothetical protein